MATVTVPGYPPRLTCGERTRCKWWERDGLRGWCCLRQERRDSNDDACWRHEPADAMEASDV